MRPGSVPCRLPEVVSDAKARPRVVASLEACAMHGEAACFRGS